MGAAERSIHVGKRSRISSCGSQLRSLVSRASREFEERTVAEAEGAEAAYQRAMQRACAWYHVTYSPEWSGYGPAAALSTRELDARLISFPWILTDYLAEMKLAAG